MRPTWEIHRSHFTSLATPIIWGILPAGSLDAAENLALPLMLTYKVVNPWLGIASWAAAAKFVLVAIGEK